MSYSMMNIVEVEWQRRRLRKDISQFDDYCGSGMLEQEKDAGNRGYRLFLYLENVHR